MAIPNNILAKSPIEAACAKMVIEVQAVYGNGVENDPCRVVMEYWSMEGELLAIRDPIIDCVYTGPRRLPQ